MKILHITNWYPSIPSPRKSPFVKKQIDALGLYTHNVVRHIEIEKGRMGIKFGENIDNSKYLIVSLPFRIWRIYEWLSFLIVLWILIKENVKNFDVLNFHIAYPNCAFIKLLKKVYSGQIVITEHWSAYHFNFNINHNKELPRIKNVFNNGIPIISVSQALANDIYQFSKAEFTSYIVPNVVDTDLFYYHPEAISKNTNKIDYTFLMISLWKWPKDPFAVIQTWPDVLNRYPEAILKIGGYGPQWEDMIKLTRELQLGKTVEFLGPMNQEQVAFEMNRATAFIHSSEYETFSIVCAESICCGTPVIASDVGGIPGIINKTNGILFSRQEELLPSIQYMINNTRTFVPESISQSAMDFYSPKEIGNSYYKALSDICGIKG